MSARKHKPTMRVLADRYAIVRVEIAVSLCVWRLCEQKAALANASTEQSPYAQRNPITPYEILAWNGKWGIESEPVTRPVDGCACSMCEARRKGGAP